MLLKMGINKLFRLDTLYKNKTLKEKKKIIGTMYPEISTSMVGNIELPG